MLSQKEFPSQGAILHTLARGQNYKYVKKIVSDTGRCFEEDSGSK